MTESPPAARADRAHHVLDRAERVSLSRPASDHGDRAAPAQTSRDAEGSRPLRDRRRGASQLLRFACVGVASTVAFTLLYLGLRSTGVTAQAANAISQFVTAVANTVVNRRVTFGIRGSAHIGWHYAQGLVAFAAGLVVTSGALAALHALSARPSRAIEVTVLVTATLVATLVRFALYKAWVFRPRQPRP
jgi:putative flippase GtrA